MALNEKQMMALEMEIRKHVYWPDGECDGTLWWTERFLDDHGFNVEAEVRDLKADLGAYCDCGVLMMRPYRTRAWWLGRARRLERVDPDAAAFAKLTAERLCATREVQA